MATLQHRHTIHGSGNRQGMEDNYAEDMRNRMYRHNAALTGDGPKEDLIEGVTERYIIPR